ncbi:MAG: amidase [Deltaproteobacteria bacterium HGW-Deltaproteobacteria-19]|jgi:amidase|nr:MAG: amidase [Deltaproteobacteria bacterium HGW-Deltaproteobacteria-19]
MNGKPSAERDRGITGLDAVDLSRAIRERQLSCREVMEAFLARIDRLNPEVNAIVSLQDREGLLSQADDRDRQIARGEYLGWMHGFPQAPKDLALTAGIPTTLGSPILRDNIPLQDAFIVERVKRCGAIIIGKTNTSEFGLGSQTYNTVFGTTLNAYDRTKTAGGSSGGAAVALALDMLPVADGSDMMGSLRNPAAYNNIFGFRPSFGRVPYGPTNEIFYQQLATEGPMGRTVTDLAMLLSVQAGFDSRVPLSNSEDPDIFTRSLKRNFKGVRVAWMGDLGGHLPMEPGILDLCGKVLKTLETIGCTVEEALPDFSPERLWQTWLTLRGFLIVGIAGPFYNTPRWRALMKPEAVWEVENGLKLTTDDVYKASVDRTAWYLALDALFQKYEYLLLPSAQVFPFYAGTSWPKEIAGKSMDTYHRWMEVVIGPTLAGLPAISVPAGFNDAGLPMGVQIIGKARADLAVLQLAFAYEQATDRVRPKR